MKRVRRKLSILTLISSFLFLLYGFKLKFTGDFINNYFNSSFMLAHLLGLILLIFGIIFFIEKKRLDYLIIPLAGESKEDTRRTKRALEEKSGYYVISGLIDKPVKDSATGVVYRELRGTEDFIKYGKEPKIKPSEMIVEGKSKDSLENFLYSMKRIIEKEKKAGRKLEEPIDVGISSYYNHLKRFIDFEKEAIKRGIIKPGEFRFHRIEIPETEEQKDYENSNLRKIIHKYKLATIKRYTSREGKIKYVPKDDPVMKLVKIPGKIKGLLSKKN